VVRMAMTHGMLANDAVTATEGAGAR
jgi:hypothetical protein